jgi:glycosyltransferase involved in cell wall biosynthesis
MRAALVTPVAPGAVRGNAVTVGRLAAGLRGRGLDIAVLDLVALTAGALEARLDGLEPDLVHAFHAFQGAPAVRGWVRARGRPFVVSLTGTDANIDLFDPERRAETAASIREAQAVVVFHETMRAKVIREVPEAAPRVEVIAQSVRLGDAPYEGVEPRSAAPGEVVFLLPAGIRKVKNVLFPLAPLGRLAGRFRIRLLVAGPVLEEDEGARLREALHGVAWASYLGPVPHAQMGALLDRCDVVLNCSLSEGGMANAVLEAMARGRPVLASDIEGNRSVIEPEVDGLLFAGAADFERQAERLVRDAGLRARLGAAARATVARRHPPEREVGAYLALYRRLAGR